MHYALLCFSASYVNSLLLTSQLEKVPCFPAQKLRSYIYCRKHEVVYEKIILLNKILQIICSFAQCTHTFLLNIYIYISRIINISLFSRLESIDLPFFSYQFVIIIHRGNIYWIRMNIYVIGIYRAIINKRSKNWKETSSLKI